MGRIQFATDTLDPHKRLLAGVVAVIGLMASMVLAVAAASIATEYVGRGLVVLALSAWIGAGTYARAWNRYSPWAPSSNGGKDDGA